jgi:hypothetical protein
MSQRSVRKYIDVCRSCLCTFVAKNNNSKDFLITVDFQKFSSIKRHKAYIN